MRKIYRLLTITFLCLFALTASAQEQNPPSSEKSQICKREKFFIWAVEIGILDQDVGIYARLSKYLSEFKEGRERDIKLLNSAVSAYTKMAEDGYQREEYDDPIQMKFLLNGVPVENFCSIIKESDDDMNLYSKIVSDQISEYDFDRLADVPTMKVEFNLQSNEDQNQFFNQIDRKNLPEKYKTKNADGRNIFTIEVRLKYKK